MKLLAISILVALSTATSQATSSNEKVLGFTNVPGFFMQDQPETNASNFDFIKNDFGLLDHFGIPDDFFPPKFFQKPDRRSSDPAWRTFRHVIEVLNHRAGAHESYKVLFLARHGQGTHNDAESWYGTPAWNCYWSLQNGNGTSNWGPDAKLVASGIQSAKDANEAWKKQLKLGAPLPESWYSSPFSRAASTLQIAWSGINEHHALVPLFKENLRETIGIHTCDKRSTKTYLHYSYPGYAFEKGFSEEDLLWKPDLREPDDALDIRMATALREIFEQDDSTYVSITAHSGVIGSILRVIGHREFSLATGAMIPVVVKVHYLKKTPSTTSLSPSGTPPICTVNPTATASGK